MIEGKRDRIAPNEAAIVSKVEGHDFGAVWGCSHGAGLNTAVDSPQNMLRIFRVKDDVLDVDEAGGGVLVGGAVLYLWVWPWLLAGEVCDDDHIVGRWARVARILYDFGLSIA